MKTLFLHSISADTQHWALVNSQRWMMKRKPENKATNQIFFWQKPGDELPPIESQKPWLIKKAMWNCRKAITEVFVTCPLFACQHSLQRYNFTTHWLLPIIKMSAFKLIYLYTHLLYQHVNILRYQKLIPLTDMPKPFITKSCIFWFKFPTYLFWGCKSAFAHMKT